MLWFVSLVLCRFEEAANDDVGELWPSERDTRAYADIVGERDKKGAQGVFQVTVGVGEATGGAEGCEELNEDGAS